MAAMTEPAAEAAISAAACVLHLPTVRADAARLADDAARAGLTHRAYLAEVLAAEVDERDARRRQRRVAEARFPRIRRLEDFDLSAAPSVNPASFAAIASLSWVEAGGPWWPWATPAPARPTASWPAPTPRRGTTPSSGRCGSAASVGDGGRGAGRPGGRGLRPSPRP
ncbi:MAG: ATP-binding protein [Actinomycetota bacterium]|nr:ATP-binding protein [Actinomycetota bacterium]